MPTAFPLSVVNVHQSMARLAALFVSDPTLISPGNFGALAAGLLVGGSPVALLAEAGVCDFFHRSSVFSLSR